MGGALTFFTFIALFSFFSYELHWLEELACAYCFCTCMQLRLLKMAECSAVSAECHCKRAVHSLYYTNTFEQIIWEECTVLRKKFKSGSHCQSTTTLTLFRTNTNFHLDNWQLEGQNTLLLDQKSSPFSYVTQIMFGQQTNKLVSSECWNIQLYCTRLS